MCIIERSDGCNFMTCISAICNNQTYFCFLCGVQLRMNQHYSHYHFKGPFGDTCNVMDEYSEDESSEEEGWLII